MCVDDYQFRHYSAIRNKECRRFIFINEDDIEKAFLVNISQFEEEGQIALCKIIFHLQSKGLLIAGRSFYWPKYNVSIQPGDYYRVSYQTLSDKENIFHTIVNVKNQPMVDHCSGFKGIGPMEEQMSERKEETDTGSMASERCGDCEFDEMKDELSIAKRQTPNDSNNEDGTDCKVCAKIQENRTKRIKEPERLISQVIIALKKWRKLYESKKLNLTKAAKVIGISKKSLDDYYLVIRAGEILEFNFQANLSHKMGDLRAFIRNFDHKVTGKLPKEVRCFELVPDFEVDQILENNHSRIGLDEELLDDN